MSQVVRVGLIGAGYIAAWHAAALKGVPQAQLVAICDPDAAAAEGLARAHGARAFTDVAEMLAEGGCDAVHVLTPPPLHAPLARQALEAGCHAVVEKPVGLSRAEVEDLCQAAEAAGRQLVAGHNFLGLPGYTRLRAELAKGTIGRVAQARIDWHLPLGPLRAGPFGLWMLREPRNLVLELGPHLFAFAEDLLGKLEILSVLPGKWIALPGGAGERPQSLRIAARAGGVEVDLALSLVETFDDRSVTLIGSSGKAVLDYARDVLVIERENASDLVVNPARRQAEVAWAHAREGLGNALRQAGSLNRAAPYALSFTGMLRPVYAALAEGRAVPRRFSGAAALEVAGMLDRVAAALPRPEASAPPAPAVQPGRAPGPPEALVIGGTGFLGRHLVHALVARGQRVRVVSRGAHSPFADLGERVELAAVSLRDAEGLEAAMRGTGTVYNLARALGKTWEECLEADVGTSDRIARAALAAGVRRFVYTGTIASYDMSDPGAVITEATGFAEDMRDRNLYARSKAECERRLLQLHAEAGLPLQIARPGIVVGAGGPLQHWGIGRWHGSGAVRLWGDGRNILPFVLARDVAEGLCLMGEGKGEDGASYNLVGPPMLTARDYFDAIQARLGARIRVASGNLTAFWAADAVKHLLKRHALGRRDAVRASRRDWLSRGHLSRFDNSGAIRDLGWHPEADREAFLRAAVDEAGLFGF